MDKLIADFHTANKTIDHAEKESERIRQEVIKGSREITFDYQVQLDAIVEKRDAEIKAFEQKLIDQIIPESTLEPHHEAIKKTERTLAYMRLFVNGTFKAETPEYYYYSDRDENGNYLRDIGKRKVYISPAAILMDDVYTKVSLFIVPNKKPVNKFSLTMIGTFPVRVPESNSFNSHEVKTTIKDDVSEALLIQYMNKNMDKIKNNLPKNLDKSAAEFEAAKNLFKNSKEWRLFYLESRKNSYEENYSGGKETEEYKDICAIINAYKNFNDLPLLVCRINSDEGKALLEKLLGL
jgi:hypothetical protein